MYLVRIEPVYSQGVGYFELVTNNVDNVKKFIDELHRYKNYLYELDPSDIDGWEFYEIIYKLTNYIPEKNDKIFNGYCIFNKCYYGNFNDDVDIKNKLENKFLEINNIIKFENDKQILVDNVYNYFDTSIKPIHIDNFDIIGKNYLK